MKGNDMKLRTNEFIRRVANKAGVTQVDARKVYDAMGEIAVEELANENAITMFKGLVIFGKQMPSRTWENPLIGGCEEIPERIVPRARFSDEFKKALREY